MKTWMLAIMVFAVAVGVSSSLAYLFDLDPWHVIAGAALMHSVRLHVEIRA